VKLVFLGTRGYIEARSELHARHSSLRVFFRGRNLTLDCGEDWLSEVASWRTEAILLTHGHPDHAWGLKSGAPCPVYATAETFAVISGYSLAERRPVVPGEAFQAAA